MKKRDLIDTDLDEGEFSAGMVMLDPLLFRLCFFSDELTEEPTFEQMLMYCDESRRVLLCTARKTSKTVHLEATVLQAGATNFPKGIIEALFFTPGEAQLLPFLDRVTGRIERTPLFKMLVKIVRRSEGIIIEFHFGLRWYFRIDGLTGTDVNMVGIRAEYVVGDECAFTNWAAHNSRLQTALPDAKFVYAGVPNGIRTTPFYALDQTSDGASWSRHKYPTFINPLYKDPARRKQLIEDYGGEESQGYITQVLGRWGEEMQSSFPPGTIAVRQNVPYFIKNLVGQQVERGIGMVPVTVGIPSIRCKKYVIGWDYGFSPDPSVLVAAYCQEEEDEWQTYLRLIMKKVALPHQVIIAKHILRSVMVGQFVGLSSDNVGLIQLLQNEDPANSGLYRWSKPAGTTDISLRKVGPDGQTLAIAKPGENDGEPAKVRNKEFYASLLKDYMVNACVGLNGIRLWLGHDQEVIEELGTVSERKTPAGYTIYQFSSEGNSKRPLDHNFDAHTYLCDAINTALNGNVQKESNQELLSRLGWVGKAREGYRPPWSRS